MAGAGVQGGGQAMAPAPTMPMQGSAMRPSGMRPAASLTAPGPNGSGMGGQGVFGQSAGALTDAMAGTRMAMGFMPASVTGQGYNAATAASTGYDPTQAATSTVAGADMNPYMNPYTQNVIDTTMGALDRSRMMAMNDTGARATGVGAFGGTRHGVAEAETNRAFMDTAGQMAAGLNQANFNNALGAAQFDTGQRNQVGLANMGASNAASQFGANAFNNASLSNAGFVNDARRFSATAANQAALANQAAGLTANSQMLGAAGQLGNLSNLGFGMGQAVNRNLTQQGAQQQAMAQAVIDAAKGQFAGWAGAPGQSLQYPLSAISSVPHGQTSETRQKPGLFNLLSLGLGLL